jgi:hypothetical protein
MWHKIRTKTEREMGGMEVGIRQLRGTRGMLFTCLPFPETQWWREGLPENKWVLKNENKITKMGCFTISELSNCG